MLRYTLSFLLLGALTVAVHAAEFQMINSAPTILYDAPSQKARPLFLYGSGVPVERISAIEGWSKVRDAQGAVGWVERSKLTDKRALQVRVPRAQIRANPADDAPLVFEAEENVLLELNEAATSPMTTLTPGWVRVRHQDGMIGYVRIGSLFGL
ncbi:MAG: SH3 domain-containing protein [Proteobacteria bacterium]|nr:SH3 domain-containing protein [Pseudomonadota bacterium]MCL2307274.1 SH3 domain-containing protein [Pseudomonadota bacterium]